MSTLRRSWFLVAGIIMTTDAAGAAEVTGPEPFGQTVDGTPVERYTLSAGKQTVKLITYGATITEWHAPDRDGQTADVVLGFDDMAGYESDANQSFGCTTGRVCNRIAKGRFTLDGKTYQLAINNDPNHLHGGPKRSLAKVVWKAEKTTTERGPGVKFTYTSPDGEEGYPGTVNFAVLYWIDDKGSLSIMWTATTDKLTPVNLTNHTYFNLAGAGAPSILDHELQLFTDRYTPVDATLIPTGKIEPVAGLPIDFFTKPHVIGERIAQLDDGPTQGYDHNYVLRENVKNNETGIRVDVGSGVFIEGVGVIKNADWRHAATLSDKSSGRNLEVSTTQPGIQFYTGNFLHDQKGKGGKTYARRSACCLETQHFPDSVNHPEFPSIILRPGETYRQMCVYSIDVEN